MWVCIVHPITFIHCLPRTGLGQSHHKALTVLKKAEAGNLTDGILVIRKAGHAYAKAFIKDSLVGLKNPIRRCRKITQTDAFLNDLSKELTEQCNAALAAYGQACTDLEALGNQAQIQWITDNVMEGINGMLSGADKVFEALDDVFRALESTDSFLAELSKDKQATARKIRQDGKRILKIFEQAGIPLLWRHVLRDAGLSIDEDNPMRDPATDFAKYTASQPAFTAELLSDRDTWALPKWYAPDDTGAYVYLV